MKDFDQEDLHLKLGENSEGEFWISQINKKRFVIVLIRNDEITFCHHFELNDFGHIYNFYIDGVLKDYEYYFHRILCENFKKMYSCYVVDECELNLWRNIDEFSFIQDKDKNINFKDTSSDDLFDVMLGGHNDSKLFENFKIFKQLNSCIEVDFHTLWSKNNKCLIDPISEIYSIELEDSNGFRGFGIFTGNVIRGLVDVSFEIYGYTSTEFMNFLLMVKGSNKRITKIGKEIINTTNKLST